MSEPRHLNARTKGRLRLPTRHAGTHRAPETEQSNDESLEVCVPALGRHTEIADLSDDIQALLAAGAESEHAPLRKRFHRQ